MSKFVSFLKLIRVQNLFILFLAQVVLYYFIYENFGDIKLYLLLMIMVTSLLQQQSLKIVV